MKTTAPRRQPKNARLGFTVPQQVIYRPMVEAAWTAFCRQTRVSPNDRAARRDWYETHLDAATGKTTTTLCNRTSDFEQAMGEFERGVGDSIKWQMRAGDGDLRRARHGLREFCCEHDVDDSYVLGTARRMFDCATLDGLKAPQLRDVLVALKLHLRRQDDNQPF